MKKHSRLKKFLLSLIVVLLLLLTLSYILNQHAQVDALIKRSNEQTTHIQKLESDVSTLRNNFIYEDKQIQELSHTTTQHIDNTNKEQVKENPQPLLSPQITIVSILVTLSGLVKTLVPSF